jgi:pimeloyl-ACP methyl ester carboxylesterase
MRVAVIVPGIMGSTLHYDDAGVVTEIWGENFRRNYSRILDQPALLSWTGKVAKASVLETIYVSDRIHFPKVDLWKRLLEWLATSGTFHQPNGVLKIGYDWRRSLVDSSKDFGNELDLQAAALAAKNQIASDEVRFTFITHSMGGLLLRCALAQHAIPLKRIDRIIHIGAPLDGAPAAFSGAYRKGGLPFLRELSRLFHPLRNAGSFFRKVLESMQTFPSAYQLMPPVGRNYLYYSASQWTNPFVDPQANITPAMKQHAAQAHQLLVVADQMVHSAGLSQTTYTIFGEHHSSKETESAFHVAAGAGAPGGYDILGTVETQDGDGTVPAASASGTLGNLNREPVVNVTHATMCNDKKVVNVLPRIV